MKNHVVYSSIVAVSMAALGLSGCQKSEPVPAAGAGAAVRVRVEPVQVSSRAVAESYAGVVRARLNAQLASKVSARVVGVFVHEGDPVKRGQLLVQLDPRDYAANAQGSAAGLTAAQVALQSSRINEQMQTSVTKARLREAQSRVESAQANLDSAQAHLALTLAGPRDQERQQAKLAVDSAQSALSLADSERSRAESLYKLGAISKRQWEQAETAYRTANAAYLSAVQAQQISQEGSRPEEIRSAREAVRQAGAGLAEARAAAREAQALAMQDDLQRQAVQAARAQVGQASAGVSAASATLSETRILAPFDGVVTSRFVDPGAFASPGMPLIAVSGGGNRLEIALPESKLASLSLGTPVDLRLDAVDKSLTGSVEEMVPQGDPSSHTFLVRIGVKGDGDVKPGMFGRADVRMAEKKALWLENDAIATRDGLVCAFVVDSTDVARLRVLALGIRQAALSEVVSGLDAGDRVVLSPPADLRDGARVEIEK